MHYEGVYYKGKVKVNLAGKWEKGFNKPLWVIGSLKPSELLGVYGLREKIEEMFRDLKNRFHWCGYKVETQERLEMLTFCLSNSSAVGAPTMVSYTIVAFLGYQVLKTNRAPLVSSYGKSSVTWLGIGFLNDRKASASTLFRQIQRPLKRNALKSAAWQ